MTRCPQCGAEVSVPEQELHPTCPFCGTAFLLVGGTASARFLVPAAADRRTLRDVIRDRLARSAVGGGHEPDLTVYYFPFRRTADGRFRPAFQSHVPELMGFRMPGSDWKRFREDLVADDAVVLEPETEEAADAVILHYPIARAAATDGEWVLWIDAARGQVLAEDLGDLRPGPRPLPPRLLLAVAATYFGSLLLLPLPWSVTAAGAATPFLYRWGARLLRETS
ncbi:MAG: zinc ribbon domain-containing protein [Acidobacteriota bacterium]|jgi:hypothetical protein